MARRSGSAVLRGAAGFMAAVILLSVPAAPATAAGLLESILGGLSRALGGAPPRQARAYAAPAVAQPIVPQQRVIDRGFGGPRQAFCVRTCDGRYFPVQAHAGLSVAEACRAFCPACETQLYYGGTIDYAVARDGSRYAGLPNAYLYRKQLVANCRCNGRSAAGLATMAPKDDPTLRRGDIVVTPNGLVAYSGGQGQAKNFTPIRSYGGLSQSERAKLSTLKVTPPDRPNMAATPVKRPATTGWDFRSKQTAQR